MKSKNKINNIKSKHILNFIFNYIKDKNFQEKLFLYSKKLQIKYGIKLIGLKGEYLKKIQFNLDKYLYIEPKLFKEDFLIKEYNKFLIAKNINKERIEKIIYEIFENKEIKELEEEDSDKIKDNEKYINIESPLFKILSKSTNFGKIFTIYISQKIIDKYKLKEEYKKFFDNLNSMNINYNSILYNLADNNKINYLKEININFNKIKSLAIVSYEDKNIDYVIQKPHMYFFEILFSFNNIENNLIYLNISFKYCIIITDLFDNINKFKSLRYLYIENINFNKEFIIKLKELKLISIEGCKNVILFEILNEKLKELYLSYNNISDINILEKVKSKELNKLDLSYNDISDINILEKVNFKELNKLNLSNNKISNINILEKVNLKELNSLDLNYNKISDIKVLEKVKFRELKELNLSHNDISDINILEKVNFNVF